MTTILETLRPFGITRCYKGFPLTVYAIHLAVMEEDRLEEITEKIYRETADHFGCKWTAVERNLRTVVSRAWQVNPDLLCRMAGYPLTAAPTASEFFQICPQQVDLVGVLRLYPAHRAAYIARIFNHALLFQLPQRLPDRCPAGAELLGQFLLGQLYARLQLPGKDLAPDGRGDTFP